MKHLLVMLICTIAYSSELSFKSTYDVGGSYPYTVPTEEFELFRSNVKKIKKTQISYEMCAEGITISEKSEEQFTSYFTTDCNDRVSLNSDCYLSTDEGKFKVSITKNMLSQIKN